jgi:uncharacterized protein YhbP (UPF0306 family)
MKLMSELDPKSFVQKYLAETSIMQLATSANNKPWICSLHFIADSESNVYWISKTNSRHSEDIAANTNIAITIAIKTEKPLIGLQSEGVAELVTDSSLISAIMGTYIERHGTHRAFVDTIIAGTNEHKLYVFHPKRYSLFDQVNFPDQPSQEWVIDRT